MRFNWGKILLVLSLIFSIVVLYTARNEVTLLLLNVITFGTGSNTCATAVGNTGFIVELAGGSSINLTVKCFAVVLEMESSTIKSYSYVSY